MAKTTEQETEQQEEHLELPQWVIDSNSEIIEETQVHEEMKRAEKIQKDKVRELEKKQRHRIAEESEPNLYNQDEEYEEVEDDD